MRLIIITSLFFALAFPGVAQRTKINAARDVTGTLPVANGGTGQTTQQAAIDALLPAQSGHAGEYLKTNGTTASWAADSGTLAIEANGSAVGSEATLNFITGTGISEMVTDAGTKINKTTAVDTAVMLTRAQAQSGGDLLCAPASASGANYTCSMTPALSAYTTGMVIQFKPDVSSSAGAVTLNVNSLGSLNIKQSDGTTDPGAAALVAGRQVPLTYDGTVLRMGVAGSGGGSGTVTSVGMSVPSEFSISGSPVTTSGTLAVSKATQTANTVWAGPTTGSAAAPAFRALVADDLPAIALDNLSDVTITSAARGQFLRRGASEWENYDPLDPREVLIRDDFTGFKTASNSSSSLAWSSRTSGGTIVPNDGVSNHPGLYNIGGGPSAGNYASLELAISTAHNTFAADTFTATTGWRMRFVVYTWGSPSLSHRKHAVGLFPIGTYADLDTGERICVRFLGGTDTNWTLITSDGTNTTTTSLGVAVANGTWYQIDIWSDSAGVISASVNGNTPGTSSAYLPTGGLVPKAISNFLGGNTSFHLDYFAMRYLTGQRY